MTQVTIGIANTMGAKPIWPFLETLFKIFMDAEIIIQSIHPVLAEEMVLSGALDACFYRSINFANPKLQTIPLYRERLRLVVAKGHLFYRSNALPRTHLQSDREDWIQSAVARNFGVTILPEHSAIMDNIAVEDLEGEGYGECLRLFNDKKEDL